jgi:hypothetical protein
MSRIRTEEPSMIVSTTPQGASISTIQNALVDVRVFNHAIQLGVQPGYTKPIVDNIQHAYDARDAIGALPDSVANAHGAWQLLSDATLSAAKAYTDGIDAPGLTQLRSTWSAAEQAVSSLLDSIGGSSNDTPRPRGI